MLLVLAPEDSLARRSLRPAQVISPEQLGSRTLAWTPPPPCTAHYGPSLPPTISLDKDEELQRHQAQRLLLKLTDTSPHSAPSAQFPLATEASWLLLQHTLTLDSSAWNHLLPDANMANYFKSTQMSPSQYYPV